MTHVTTPSHLNMLLHVAMFTRIMVIHLPKGAKISLVFVNPGDCKDQFGDFLCCVRVLIHDFSHLFSRITNKNFIPTLESQNHIKVYTNIRFNFLSQSYIF